LPNKVDTATVGCDEQYNINEILLSEFMVMGERALGSGPSSKYLPRIKRKKYDVNITFNQAYYW